MTRDGVAHLEQGRRKPSWETVLALAAALGVDCKAFEQAPTPRADVGPGRPPKAKEAKPPPAPKMPVRRKKKGE
jgi:hypothetical protein